MLHRAAHDAGRDPLRDAGAVTVQLAQLDLRRCPSLRILHCSNTPLTELDLTACAELHEVYCQSTLITKLDLSNCVKLTRRHFYAFG